MDSGFEVGIVTRDSERRPAVNSTADPAASAIQTNSQTTDSAPPSDAVVVSVSKSASQANSLDAPRIGSPEDALQKAKEIAKKLDNVAAEIQSTKVTFDLSIQQEGRSSLSFQVVDKESGKVVRQFPPEIEAAFTDKIDQVAQKGVLVEDVV